MAYLPILYRIQEIESRLQALKRVKEKIRTDVNLLPLESLKNQLQELLVKIEAERKKNNNISRQLELDLKTAQEHLKHEEEKLYNGSVATSRGLEQIQQKIAEYSKGRGNIEDQILVLLEEDEKITAHETDSKKRLEVCNHEINLIQQEIKQKLGEVTLEESDLQPELGQLFRQIPPEWLERYQKIANAHFGVGIARIKAGSCGACHVGLSEALLQKVKRGEDALYYCENCGRILYF